MAELLYTYADPPAEKHLDKACKVLDEGGVLAYAVGSNWAFGCDPRRTKGLETIQRLKPEHPKSKSLSLLCADIAMAARFGHIDHALYRILKKAWPGPYTIIVRSNRELPRKIKDKRQVVGLRVPECPLIRAIIQQYDFPIVSSSVPSQTDGTPFRMGYQIDEAYGHALALVLDLGDELTGEESTVVSFVEGYPEVIREGLGDVAIFG